MVIDFQEWVSWVFDHPVSEPSWYWNEEAMGLAEPSVETFTVISQLFEEPADVLRPYSDEQLDQGFWFLLGGPSQVMRGLTDETIEWNVRERCIGSFATLFRNLFMPRCTPHLSHLLRTGDPVASEVGPLNSACYMWWDFDCWCARAGDDAHRKLDNGFLDVMRQTLELPHDACRESALHGLGHWHREYPNETGEIIDEFLAGNKSIRGELRRYAMAARGGCVL